MTQYRVEVDHETCAGSAICAGLAPRYFEMDHDHVARPIHALVDTNDEVVEAARNCPVDAIALFDADTGRRVAGV